MSSVSTTISTITPITFSIKAFMANLDNPHYEVSDDIVSIIDTLPKYQIERIAKHPRFCIVSDNSYNTEKLMSYSIDLGNSKVDTFTETINIAKTMELLHKYKSKIDFDNELIDSVQTAIIDRGLKFSIAEVNDDATEIVGDFIIPISEFDCVQTICHEGQNRSQISHLAVASYQQSVFGRTKMMYPHGADSGFYPYQGYSDLNDETWTQFIHGAILPPSTREWQHHCFVKTFDIAKEERVGSKFSTFFKLCLNPNEDNFSSDHFKQVELHRRVIRKLMDVTYHNVDYITSIINHESPLKKEGDMVYICFMRSASKLVKRLFELNPDKDLSKIRIYCIPLADTIARAGGLDQRKNIFKTYDFELIKNLGFVRAFLNGFPLYQDLGTSISCVSEDFDDIQKIKEMADKSTLLALIENCKAKDTDGFTCQDYLRNFLSQQAHYKFYSSIIRRLLAVDSIKHILC